MALTQTRIRDLYLYNSETNPTPIDQLYLIVDHPSFTDPLKILFPISAASSDVLLGGNLISSSGWTSTGWTGNESIGWTHTAGNTNALSNTLAAIIDSNYQLQITVTNRTAGSFTVAFGGDTSITLNSSAYYTILATTNGNLVITPSSDFDGTIIIAIKEVIWDLTEAEILDILGLTGETIASQTWVTAGFVAKIVGSSLIADSEKTRLASVKSNPYKISMPTGDIITKVSGATFTPIGWATVAQTGDTGITITHTLTGRKAKFINVFKVNGSDEEWLSAEKGMAYSGFKNNGLTTFITGFAPTTLAVNVNLIFE